MILALDLGTRTGWATNKGSHIVLGHIDLKNSRFEGGGMRYLRFHCWLDGFSKYSEGMKFTPLEAIYFEEVRHHAAVDAAHVHGGLLATLTSWCEANKIPYEGVPVGTIKKFATGKGNANKAAMIFTAKEAGACPVDDNEADAYWILRWALDQTDIFA